MRVLLDIPHPSPLPAREREKFQKSTEPKGDIGFYSKKSTFIYFPVLSVGHNRDVNQSALGICDFFEGRPGQIDLPPQTFSRAAIIHTADHPLSIQRVDDHQLSSERIIPGGTGHFPVVELFAAGRFLIDVFIGLAVPRSDSKLRFRKIKAGKTGLQIMHKHPNRNSRIEQEEKDEEPEKALDEFKQGKKRRSRKSPDSSSYCSLYCIAINRQSQHSQHQNDEKNF